MNAGTLGQAVSWLVLAVLVALVAGWVVQAVRRHREVREDLERHAQALRALEEEEDTDVPDRS